MWARCAKSGGNGKMLLELSANLHNVSQYPEVAPTAAYSFMKEDKTLCDTGI